MEPDPAHDWYLNGLAHARERRWDEAHASVERAIAEGGERPEFLLLLGSLRLDRGHPAKARAAFERCLALAPSNLPAQRLLARAHACVGDLLADAGRTAEAHDEYGAALRRDPASLRAALGSNLVLPQVYEDRDHVERSRAAYAQGLERLHERSGAFRFANPGEALAQASWTNFFLAYQGGDDRTLQARYGDFLERLLSPVAPELFEPRPPRPPAGRIRVGFASHFFLDGTVGRYFAPWITRLDRSRFEVFVYHSHPGADALTQAIAAAADAFRSLAGRPVLARAQQIAADALDVLVYPESGMHNVTYLLGALRLAPVQCCAWGHPDTTGHANMDWFLSCEAMEPPGAAARYREKLALLPGLGTRYAAARVPPDAARAALGLPESSTLYLVPQSLFKIHPDNDELVARVLERDPDGIAVMLVSPLEAVTRDFQARLDRALARRGLALGERVRFLPRLAHGDYLRLNAACDVMLDTLHWSGGNTSLDAIAAGLPIVTCPGELMRSRQSAAMVATLGLPESIAADPDAYVDTAVRLGRDRGQRRELGARMRAAHPALFDRDEPVRAFEDFLERAARGD